MAKKKAYDPADREIKFSRTAMDEFLDCQRCFYFYRRLGHRRPSGGMSGIPGAIDGLLKREFDDLRERNAQHPVMADLPGTVKPFSHPSLEDWRNNSRGVMVTHEASGFVFSGAIDDLWIDEESQKLHVVDYKTTASATGPSLDTEWGQKYKKQVEMYQYLLRGNGFDVSDTAYFLFLTADKSSDSLDETLRFTSEVLPYVGSTDWIDEELVRARACLDADQPPAVDLTCEWCTWASIVSE